MSRTPQKRSKEKGYELERAVCSKLTLIWPGLRRTGSVNYKEHAPDLVQDGEPPIVYAVVTRDRNQPILITLEMDQFITLVRSHVPDAYKVAVQCKYRQNTWVGTLMRGLKKGARS